MEKRQLCRVFPILGGLLALLVFGAILYNQLASESQTSSSEVFSQRSSSGAQAKAGEYAAVCAGVSSGVRHHGVRSEAQ